jgi:hypothetical protein
MVAMPLRTSARTSNAAPQDRTAIRAARKTARLLPAIDRWLRYRTALMNGCKATGCFPVDTNTEDRSRLGGFRPEKGGSIWPSHPRRGG